MIEILTAQGYQPVFFGSFDAEYEAQQIGILETSLPEGTPILIQLNFSEIPTIESLCALEFELSKTDAGNIFPSKVYVDDNNPSSVYIVYSKGIGITTILLPILLLIGLPVLLGGLVWKFLIPDSFKQTLNMIGTLIVVMIMMKVMSGIFKDDKKKASPPPKAVRARPPVPVQPPIEQRIADRVESIADSITRIDRAFRKSESEGAAKVTSIATDIGKVASDVRTADIPVAKKVHIAERLSRKQKNLVENYEDRLSPKQRQILEDERRIVEELRTMYDQEYD